MSVSPTVMRRLMREISELTKNPPEGIRVVTGEDNMLDLTGIIEGPEGTPYAGGYFKIKFRFTEEFPAAPPRCSFQTKIFHPNISHAGEICVNTLKKDWQASFGIAHILVTVKCLLMDPNPESALDEEAGKLLLEDYDAYCERAKLITSVHARSRPPEFDNQSPQSQPAQSTSTSQNTAPPSLHPASSTPVPPLKAASKDSGKERHTSPAPLGTADSNAGGSKVVEVEPAATSSVAAPAAKSMKRAATGNVLTGAEKRKKALKRL